MKVNKSKRRKHARATNGSGTLVKHGKYWHARWCVNGRLISKSLKTEDRDEAQRELERLAIPRAGQSDRQTLRKIAQTIQSTMSDVADSMKHVSLPISALYSLFEHAPNRPQVSAGTLRCYRGQFSVLADWLRAHHPEISSIRDISQTIADEYAAWRAETKSPNTHNKDLNLFAQTWRILAPRYGLDYNPWTEERIARLKLRPNARRALTPDEVARLLDCATPEERTIITIALFTALRLGDIVRLKWNEIDFKKLWITRVTHKTGRTVSLPIVPPLADALRHWRDTRKKLLNSEYVFPDQISRLRSDGNTEHISRSFKNLFEGAGIKTHDTDENGRKFRAASFHSLRHTFVSSLIASGVNPLIVREAAGHSVMATTAGYTHIGADSLRTALSALAPVTVAKS